MLNEEKFDQAIGLMVSSLFPVFIFCAALLCMKALYNELHEVYWHYYWKCRKDDDYGA